MDPEAIKEALATLGQQASGRRLPLLTAAQTMVTLATALEDTAKVLLETARELLDESDREVGYRAGGKVSAS